MVNTWIPERKARQAELIKRWKPWAKSTGPRSLEGKLHVGQNAYKGGHRQKLRQLVRLVNEEVRQSRDLIVSCR